MSVIVLLMWLGSIFVSVDTQDCTFSDETVVLTAENVIWKESCEWWTCKNDAFAGAGCGIACSEEVSQQCASNEYVEACSAPYVSACRKCRFSEKLDFTFDEGYFLDPVLSDIWTTDILQGAGNFENGKVQDFGKGIRRAVNEQFMPEYSAVMFEDVVFLPAEEDFRTKQNTWYGRGLVSLLFSSPGDARGLGAIDSRAYMKIDAPGGDIYRFIASPGLSWFDPLETGETDNEDYAITEYIVSYYWSRSLRTAKQTQITVQIFQGDTMPPSNSTFAIETSVTVIPVTDTSFGWQNVHVPLINIPRDADDYVFKLSVSGNMDIFLDEIRVMPNLIRAGNMEKVDEYHPLINQWTSDQKGGRNAYSNYASIESKVNGRFKHGSWFLLLEGSNDTMRTGTYSQGTFHKAYHSLVGSWVTLRLWVIPMQDPMSLLTPSVFRVAIIADTINATTREVVMKHSLTSFDWHMFETNFPVVSDFHGSPDMITFQSLSGADLAFDNIEVYLESGVCPYECETSKNRVRVNGGCELCSATNICDPGERNIGCEISGLKNQVVCQPCNETGFGAFDTLNGTYAANTERNGECWFECEAEFWFDESRRICVACTQTDVFYCGTGEYVKACAARMDTHCSLCSTFSTSNRDVVFASSNLDRSLVNSSENEQCLENVHLATLSGCTLTRRMLVRCIIRYAFSVHPVFVGQIMVLQGLLDLGSVYSTLRYVQTHGIQNVILASKI